MYILIFFKNITFVLAICPLLITGTSLYRNSSNSTQNIHQITSLPIFIFTFGNSGSSFIQMYHIAQFGVLTYALNYSNRQTKTMWKFVCVWVWALAGERESTHTHTHTCVCACTCGYVFLMICKHLVLRLSQQWQYCGLDCLVGANQCFGRTCLLQLHSISTSKIEALCHPKRW